MIIVVPRNRRQRSVMLFIDLPHFFRFHWVLFSKVMFSALFDFTIRTPVHCTLYSVQYSVQLKCYET